MRTSHHPGHFASVVVALFASGCSVLSGAMDQLNGTPYASPAQPAAPAASAAPGAAPAPTAVAVAKSGAAPAPAATTAPAPTTVPPTPTRRAPSPAMIGLREGLASLNTYRLTIKITTIGPAATDRNEFTMLQEVDNPKKASHMRSESREVSADSPNGSGSPSESFTIANQQCDVSGTGANLKGKLADLDPLQQDLTNTFTGLADITLSTEGAAFVAEEAIDGIPVNHFTTKITKLGKESGAEVRASKGDYWLARDGQYLIKYVVALDMANAPKANAKAENVKIDMSYELSSINKPIPIAFPAICKK